MSPPAHPAVRVEGLVVRYGALVAVDHLDLSAEAGEVVALLGPNGAGKTSTVEALEGYRPAAAGAVRVLGLDPHHDHAELRTRIGVMLQSGGVYPTMRPTDALELFASYYANPADPQALLDQVGLTRAASTPWRRLSGGEQQRLALALALVGRPEVAFLDEPTAGLDPQARHLVRQIITDLAKSGTCVLLTTHQLEEAERLADKVVIINEGKKLAEGPPAALTRAAATNHISFATKEGLDAITLGAHLQAKVTERTPGEYEAETEPTPAAIASLTAWLAEHDLPLRDLRTTQTLEETYLHLLSRAPDPEGEKEGRETGHDAPAGGLRGAGVPIGDRTRPAGHEQGDVSSRRRRPSC